MIRGTRWVWLHDADGARVLAYVYVDPTAGPSAKGSVVDTPATQAQIRNAIDHPDQTFRDPTAFGATPIGPEDALRLGLPKDPPWIGIFENKPVPPPRGEASRTVIASVQRGGVPAAGARVRMGYALGLGEFVPLDERRTDAGGRCEFPLAPLKPIVVQADAPNASSKIVDVPDTSFAVLELLPTCTLDGEVRKNGVVVAAAVSLTPRNGGAHRTRRTDQAGRYRIEGIVPGSYSVEVLGIHPTTMMTAGTPTFDELELVAGQSVRRDYALVAGTTIRISVAVESQDHSGNVVLFAGTVAPATLPQLNELYAALDQTQRRAANSYSSDGRVMTTELLDVVPGTYTVCLVPWDRRGEGHADQPVVSRVVVVGTAPISIELTLPPLKPR